LKNSFHRENNVEGKTFKVGKNGIETQSGREKHVNANEIGGAAGFHS